ncbi:MAG TPA: hypothetical protein VIK09_04275 [Candidatus Humimicrobiaceae bacterium]
MSNWLIKYYRKIMTITVWGVIGSLIIIIAATLLIYKSFGMFTNELALIFMNLWVYLFIILMSILRYKKKFWIFVPAAIFGLLTVIFAASIFF